MSYSLKAHYLDASALVKVVADDPDEEPGRKALHDYLYGGGSHEHAHMYATSLCVTEALSVYKRKFLRGQILEDKYIQYVQATVCHPHPNR